MKYQLAGGGKYCERRCRARLKVTKKVRAATNKLVERADPPENPCAG